MKLSTSYLVGFIFVGVAVILPLAQGDISLILKNPQQYLPPDTSADDQQKFDEAKYAYSKYQVFEVHNHFEPLTALSSNEQTSSNDSSNTYVQEHTKEVRIEHINAPPGFPLHDHNLDVSLLNVAAADGDSQQIILQHESASASNPATNRIPVQPPSNYDPNLMKKSTNNSVEYVLNTTNDFKLASLQNRDKQNAGSFPVVNYLPSVSNAVERVQSHQHSLQILEKAAVNVEETSLRSRPPYKTTRPESITFKGIPYLPPHHGNNGNSNNFKGTNNPYESQDLLPPHSSGSSHLTVQKTAQLNNHFKEPNHLHSRGEAFGQSSFKSGSYKDLDNLLQNGNGDFNGSDYLPPLYSQSQRIEINNAVFKTTGYLPPGYDFHKPPNSEEAITELHTLPEQNEGFLPPVRGIQTSASMDCTPIQSHRSSGSKQVSSAIQTIDNRRLTHQASASGYLPPTPMAQVPINSEQVTSKLRLHHLNGSQQFTSQVQTVQANGGPYLPPNSGSQVSMNSEQDPTQVYRHQLPVSQQLSAPAQTAQATKPTYNDRRHASHTSESRSFLNSEHATTQVHQHQITVFDPIKTKQSGSTYQAPGYLPPTANVNTSVKLKQASTQEYVHHELTVNEGKALNTASFLPTGYDFKQPQDPKQSETFYANAQRNVIRSSASQTQTSNVVQQACMGPANLPQSQTAAFKGSDYLHPVTTSHHSQSPGLQYGTPLASVIRSSSFKGSEQLSSSTEPDAQAYPVPVSMNVSNYKAPRYIPPSSDAYDYSTAEIIAPKVHVSQTILNAQQSQYKAAGYLPPTTGAQIHPTFMYPLSIYMTFVQPYDRYGSMRQSFPKYGPPTSQIHLFVPTKDVASMYKEPASRPQYYAPTMSYAKNAVSSQTFNWNAQQRFAASVLNQQALQALQTFMPKDLRRVIPPTRTHSSATTRSTVAATTTASKMQTSSPASAKIRTVQIVNPNTVKTLKVLESLDNAGVKTIKILGSTNEDPMGDHRVVKVVSGYEQTVQTVKIYNDQKDATPSASVPPASAINNGYLPPRQKRNPQKWKRSSRIAEN